MVEKIRVSIAFFGRPYHKAHVAFQRKVLRWERAYGGDCLVKNEVSGAKDEKANEEVKIFPAKSMVDGDLRMPKALRKKINWLKNHTDVTFEIVGAGKNTITLKISKST